LLNSEEISLSIVNFCIYYFKEKLEYILTKDMKIKSGQRIQFLAVQPKESLTRFSDEWARSNFSSEIVSSFD